MIGQPKAKTMRRFGEVLVPRPKYQKIVGKRPYAAGEHGKDKTLNRRRTSDYSLQLNEKQKLKFIYNVRERQLLNYFDKASKAQGITGHTLLALLERRLDAVVYRAGFGATIWAARQLVTHGHILVDGQRVDIASYLLKPNQVISIHPKMRRNIQIIQWMEEQRGNVPAYLNLDATNFSVTLVRVPEREEIPVPVNEQLVVEFYNR
jgi:small subunit ribosomal protein S4